MVGLAIAALRLAGPASAAAGALPKDPCALLKPAEIQALASNAKIGSGVVDASMAPLGNACTYSWGPRTREWGESAVTITVIDAEELRRRNARSLNQALTCLLQCVRGHRWARLLFAIVSSGAGLTALGRSHGQRGDIAEHAI